MSSGADSPLATLLKGLGAHGNELPLGILLILVFEITFVTVAGIQAYLERSLSWSPVILSIAVWVVWTGWHSWLFPRKRLRYLERGGHPYRKAFLFDIYPWVSIGFAQMWRPLINGDHLGLLGTFMHGKALPVRHIHLLGGLTLCLIALAVMIHAFRTIGIHNAGFFREFVEPETFLPVRAGIYTLMRHPLFWSGILYSCGLAMIVPNRTSLAIAGINVIYGFVYGPLENRRLARIFGEAYEAYLAGYPNAVLPPIRHSPPSNPSII